MDSNCMSSFYLPSYAAVGIRRINSSSTTWLRGLWHGTRQNVSLKMSSDCQVFLGFTVIGFSSFVCLLFTGKPTESKLSPSRLLTKFNLWSAGRGLIRSTGKVLPPFSGVSGPAATRQSLRANALAVRQVSHYLLGLLVVMAVGTSCSDPQVWSFAEKLVQQSWLFDLIFGRCERRLPG